MESLMQIHPAERQSMKRKTHVGLLASSQSAMLRMQCADDLNYAR